MQKPINITRIKIQSACYAIIIVCLIFLFFYLYFIPIPNPLFPESTAIGGGGVEINFGTYNEGSGTIENNGIGEAEKVIDDKAITNANDAPEQDVYASNETDETVIIKKSTKNIVKKQIIHKIKPQKNNQDLKPEEVKTTAQLMAEKFKKLQTKTTGGGDGNSDEAGNEGDPNGNPNTQGDEIERNGEGAGNGVGKSSGGFGFDLSGRQLLTPPILPRNITEEGKVVVEIIVDKNGTVIKAEANGRGTNTNSSNLKTIARQAAFATKFNNNKFDKEQKGTLTIIFKF